MRVEEAVLTSPRLLTGKAAEARPELSLPAPSSPRAAGARGSAALAQGGGRDPPCEGGSEPLLPMGPRGGAGPGTLQ